MIFVTVGSQLPFDRLIKAVDSWAEQNNRTDIFAQIGKAIYQPECIEAVNFLAPDEFQDKFQAADFIIGHAGMGTIITAMEYSKELLIMPRQVSFKETRNDHQIGTAKRFCLIENIYSVFDERELIHKIDFLLKNTGTIKNIPSARAASSELVQTIRSFIEK